MKRYLTVLLLFTCTAQGQERPLAKAFCGLGATMAEPYQEKRLDRVGDYDIVSLEAQLSTSGGGFYDRATYHVNVLVLIAIENEISFFMPGLDVAAVTIRDSNGNQTSASFRTEPDTGLVYIGLDIGLSAESIATFGFDGSLALERVCTSPRNCILDGDYQHLATAGWYPMSDTYATDDRFHIRTSLVEPMDSDAIGRTIGVTPSDETDSFQFETATRTYLPAVIRGPYRFIQGDAGFQFFAPKTVEAVIFNEDLAESQALYERLFGEMPFSPIQVATISDEAGVAIGAQALILVPAGLWRVPREDPFFETVLDILSHELAHQYFFNLVGITDPRDGWMSEGFAEYAASRASEIRNGDQQHIMRNYWSYMLAVDGDNDAPIYGLDVRESPIVYEILYHKGSSILEMLRRRLGTESFDQAILDYTQQFANQIATTAEFEAYLSGQFPESNIEDFFENWVYRDGYPEFTIRARRRRLDSSQLTVETSVRLSAGAPPFVLPIPIRIVGPEGFSRGNLNAQLSEQTLALDASAYGLKIDPDVTFFRRIYPEPTADLNLNGIVDGMDLLDVTHSANRPRPGLGWNEVADVNGDGTIDTQDVDQVIDQFGTINAPR